MYLKIMDNVDKRLYRIIECTDVTFHTEDDNNIAVTDKGAFFVEGNAYILNDKGQTIDSCSFTTR